MTIELQPDTPAVRIRRALQWPTIRPWIVWGAILTAATVAMYFVRYDINEGHVALAYLLIVLGGSVSGGRALGLTLACSGFLLIDYYFQPPYDQWNVSKPLDWVALISFLVVAAVGTQLLVRAQQAASRARQRADEVASLSRVGAEALNAGRAADALHAIADIVQRTLHAFECVIFAWTDNRLSAEPIARAGHDDRAPETADRELMTWAGEHGFAAAVQADGRIVRGAAVAGEDALGIDADDACEILLPLRVNARTVGVLRVSAAAPIARGVARRRFLGALAYYAALGIERLRLETEADHAGALREADRMKDFVLASVSHDLRTPLTAIKALAHDAAGRGEPSAVVIEEQADRLGRMVGDLLDLSRMKAGPFPVRAELNTAEDLIGAVLRQVGQPLDGRLHTPRLNLDQPALLGRFDFVQSMRILVNLIENADRYAPPGTTIDLEVRRDGETIRFTVSDRGPGVPPSEEQRIFHPFYQPVTRTGAKSGGAGLGLAIARGLAQAQGGDLRYEPRGGGGSVFALSLPALNDATLASPAPLATT
ncbi:MAG TPA: ATP-binding protein [Gemmatimonadaceae bacterium]|nr:ATP-binding protein [Gemmatimonadaceae bacterium]